MKIVTGYTGVPHVSSQQQADLYASLVGTSENYVFNIGSKFNYEIVTANLIKIHDGVAIMQGREVCIEHNYYDECTIANGTQGQNRRDLICIKYTKDSQSGIENAETVVLQGTPTGGTPVNPTYTSENIREGGYTAYLPLYSVLLTGITLTSVTPMFTVQKAFTNPASSTESGIVSTSEQHFKGLKWFDDDLVNSGSFTCSKNITAVQDVKANSGAISLTQLKSNFDTASSLLNAVNGSLYYEGGVETAYAVWGFYGTVSGLPIYCTSTLPVHECTVKHLTYATLKAMNGDIEYTVSLSNPVMGTEYVIHNNGFSFLSGGRIGSNTNFMNAITQNGGKACKITYSIVNNYAGL